MGGFEYLKLLISHTRIGCDIVWVMFSLHILGTIIQINHCLNATAYLSMVADYVHPFMATLYPSSNGFIQHDNAPCHKVKVVSNIQFHEHDNKT